MHGTQHEFHFLTTRTCILESTIVQEVKAGITFQLLSPIIAHIKPSGSSGQVIFCVESRHQSGAAWQIHLDVGWSHVGDPGGRDLALHLQEECGPLGMGSRGVDEMCTPPKKGTPGAMLKMLAHKVSPMRMANPFSSPNKLF